MITAVLILWLAGIAMAVAVEGLFCRIWRLYNSAWEEAWLLVAACSETGMTKTVNIIFLALVLFRVLI